MLTILIGRAKTGKSDTILRRMAELEESSQQILLVPGARLPPGGGGRVQRLRAIPPAVMPRC